MKADESVYFFIPTQESERPNYAPVYSLDGAPLENVWANILFDQPAGFATLNVRQDGAAGAATSLVRLQYSARRGRTEVQMTTVGKDEMRHEVEKHKRGNKLRRVLCGGGKSSPIK